MAKNAASTTEPEAPVDGVAGKGHATPSRKEKEAARKRPLVSSDRTEARRRSRDATNAERERARVGMAAGEEKYLPARDRGVQKRYVRDYVDARFSVGEGLIPVMGVVIVLSLFTGSSGSLQVSAMLLLYLFFAAAIIDAVVAGTIVNRRLTAKFGDRVEKVRWYTAMRAFQLRPMRMPKPQVKRGQRPTL